MSRSARRIMYLCNRRLPPPGYASCFFLPGGRKTWVSVPKTAAPGGRFAAWDRRHVQSADSYLAGEPESSQTSKNLCIWKCTTGTGR